MATRLSSGSRSSLPIKLVWVDASRSLSIFLVVWFHVCEPHLRELTRNFSALPIPMFLFLAGFQYVQRDARHLFVSRCLPLVMVYLYFGLATYGFWVFKNYLRPDQYFDSLGLVTPVVSFLYGAVGPTHWLPFNPPLWFLTFLVSSIVCYAGVLHVARSPVTALALSLLLSGGGYLLATAGSFRLPWNIDIALYTLPMFALGAVAKEYRWDDLGRRQPMLAAPLGVTCALVSYALDPGADYFSVHELQFGNPVTALIDSTFAVIALMLLSAFLPKQRVFQTLGRNLTVVFVLHFSVFMVMNAVLKRLLGPAVNEVYASIPLSISLSCVCIAGCIAIGSIMRRHARWMLLGSIPRVSHAGRLAVNAKVEG